MKVLYNYLKKQKKYLAVAIVLACINQLFSLMDPQIFRILIDKYATNYKNFSQSEFIKGILLLLSLYIMVAFISRIAKNFQDYFVNIITQTVGTNLYADGVSHAFSLSYSVFEDQRSGEILQKLQKARTDSQSIITSFVNTVFLSLTGMTFVLIYAFYVHWLIGICYLLTIPVLGTIIFYIGRSIKKAQKQIVLQTAELSGSTTESLRNVELVKSLGLENQEIERLNKVNDEILKLELKKIKFIRLLSFLQGSFVNFIRALIMFLMLWLIFKGHISLGEFFTLYFYSFYVFFPLGELGTVASQYYEAKASLEELDNILKLKPEKKCDSPVVLDSLNSIEFRDVTFSYGESNSPSVKNMNFKVEKGKTIAFVGPSGSGKTTVIKLLVGLYKPLEGKILLNSINSNLLDYDDLRKRIGYVSQETQLFAGSIKENLLFVNPLATDEECLTVLKHSSIIGILERGEKGLDTKIGESGIKLSGGERQRLAIARALLREPELLIFDEATSSLDSITEKAITETIREIPSIRNDLITILVAHRLSTISHGDIIYVMEKGEIIEQGSHSELLKLGGLYASLWREQSGNAQKACIEHSG